MATPPAKSEQSFWKLGIIQKHLEPHANDEVFQATNVKPPAKRLGDQSLNQDVVPLKGVIGGDKNDSNLDAVRKAIMGIRESKKSLVEAAPPQFAKKKKDPKDGDPSKTGEVPADDDTDEDDPNGNEKPAFDDSEDGSGTDDVDNDEGNGDQDGEEDADAGEAISGKDIKLSLEKVALQAADLYTKIEDTDMGQDWMEDALGDTLSTLNKIASAFGENEDEAQDQDGNQDPQNQNQDPAKSQTIQAKKPGFQKESLNEGMATDTRGKPLSDRVAKTHHDANLYKSGYRIDHTTPKLGQSHPTATYIHSSGHEIDREHDTGRGKVGYWSSSPHTSVRRYFNKAEDAMKHGDAYNDVHESSELSEVSKATLARYIGNARFDASSRAEKVGFVNGIAATVGTNSDERKERDADSKKHGRRTGGIQTAVGKLAGVDEFGQKPKRMATEDINEAAEFHKFIRHDSLGNANHIHVNKDTGYAHSPHYRGRGSVKSLDQHMFLRHDLNGNLAKSKALGTAIAASVGGGKDHVLKAIKNATKLDDWKHNEDSLQEAKSNNTEYGYHGTMATQYGDKKAANLYSSAHAHVKKIAAWNEKQPNIKTRDFLDSTHGRHLADIEIQRGRNSDEFNSHVKNRWGTFSKSYHPDYFKEDSLDEAKTGLNARGNLPGHGKSRPESDRVVKAMENGPRKVGDTVKYEYGVEKGTGKIVKHTPGITNTYELENGRKIGDRDIVEMVVGPIKDAEDRVERARKLRQSKSATGKNLREDTFKSKSEWAAHIKKIHPKAEISHSSEDDVHYARIGHDTVGAFRHTGKGINDTSGTGHILKEHPEDTLKNIQADPALNDKLKVDPRYRNVDAKDLDPASPELVNGINEINLQEVSKALLGRYIKKASKSGQFERGMAGYSDAENYHSGKLPGAKAQFDKVANKRQRGIETATDKIVKEHIEKTGDKYRLLSHKGKNLGTFDSHAAAETHERQVNYFKSKG